MPAVDKLLLEEALQDSPQTRSLLSVFEEDAATLTDYTNQLLQAMQRVYGAQNEMCLATQQLSKQLLAYEKQNFALGKGDEEVISTLHYFSKVVDELNVLHTELAKQLADTMVLPIIQFREKDLTGNVPEFSASYLQNISSFHDTSDCTNFFKYVHHVDEQQARAPFFLSGHGAFCGPSLWDPADFSECGVSFGHRDLGSTDLNALYFRGIILQAESRKENEEWICAINNISRQIYLTDNPEAVAIKLNQTALQAVTPITSFGKKPESSCPSQNLRNAETEDDKIVSQAAVRADDADELIAPGTPIQFDIVLPATEFLDQNRGSRRINPFGETEDETFPEAEDSLLQQMFVVRFLGSMAVKTDNTTEVIYEAMRQVLAARAIHNIFRTTESHLMVTSQTLRLIDPQTQVTRANFELTSITQFAAHQENKRLVGFVVRTPESTGGQSLSTYVFESNSEGEKICYAINLGKEIIAVQKDPEALAQLMLSIPLTNDGKYVLLNDQPDDNDGSPNENRGAESEA
uniref:DCC-interacting protein 13-beta n=1 Tax=Panthera onca TaxID=9690 RepID=UPI002954AFD1|nr:DCC-interacting protein 13-beta [Panthera onca]